VRSWELLVVFGAAVVGGGVNAVAGGGTLVSFPALIWLGRDPVLANTTNALGLLPGTVLGALGFRGELARSRDWVALLLLPSAAGGVAGAILLLRTPSATFEVVVPWLILAATLLLAAQEPLSARLRQREAIRLGPAGRSWRWCSRPGSASTAATSAPASASSCSPPSGCSACATCTR
jgi:uncharacterized protein